MADFVYFKGGKMVNVGIIGCGHWGPNHIRIFNQLSNARSLICADVNEERLKLIRDIYPKIQTTKNYKDILENRDVDAVCVAAPTDKHFFLSMEALKHGKHVLCEKPLTLKSDESSELKLFAEKQQKILMVGHVFLFNAGIIWLKNFIESGELGKVYYGYATRTNLGPFRYDVNALWDLAPHDISIFNYIFNSVPLSVSATGHNFLETAQDDLAFATLGYPDNITANIHVSWLDPRKVRQITIVGDKRMVIWDDLDNIGPIKVYDKHVEKTSTFYETYGEFQLLSKEGSITIPKVGFGEPLKAQGQYFINCIEQNINPDLSDAQKGLDVVKTLCSIQESIEKKGLSVEVSL